MDPHEVYNFIQTAAGDVGQSQAQQFNEYGPIAVDEEYAKLMEKLLKDGVPPIFLGDHLADYIYNDVGFLQDMLGDRIHGESNREEILDYLENIGHTAMKTAVTNLRRKTC